MSQQSQTDFEREMLPHLDAAHNLARWLMRDEHDAQDVVQEAFLRACRFFADFRGGSARAWILKIVRNACRDRLRQGRVDAQSESYDEALHAHVGEADDPQLLLLQRANVQAVRGAIENLPPDFREIVILREMEGLSYKEIADLAELPIGTVMSRLARARDRLAKALSDSVAMEAAHGL